MFSFFNKVLKFVLTITNNCRELNLFRVCVDCWRFLGVRVSGVVEGCWGSMGIPLRICWVSWGFAEVHGHSWAFMGVHGDSCGLMWWGCCPCGSFTVPWQVLEADILLFLLLLVKFLLLLFHVMLIFLIELLCDCTEILRKFLDLLEPDFWSCDLLDFRDRPNSFCSCYFCLASFSLILLFLLLNWVSWILLIVSSD